MARWGGWVLRAAPLILMAWGLSQADLRPTITLERGEKTIRAVKNGPDEAGVPLFIEYEDLVRGPLEALDPATGVLTVNGTPYYTDEETVWEGSIEPQRWVEVVYNTDLQDAQGRPYAIRVAAIPPAAAPEAKTRTRLLLFDPEPYRVEVTFGTRTVAYAHIALVERVKEERETLVLADGTVTYLEAEDAFEVAFTPTPQAVEVRQGESVVFGTRLDYDNATGLAVIAGPVRFARAGDPPINGTAQSMTYSVDDETLTLKGEVQLVQGERTTRAAQAVVREDEGLAFLYGDPVASEGPDGQVEGRMVRYHLESGELVVLEGVTGTFEDR